jgi:ATP-dependent RNA helicase DeaD
MTEPTPSEHTPDQAHTNHDSDNQAGEPTQAGEDIVVAAASVGDAPVGDAAVGDTPGVEARPTSWDELDLPPSLRATVEAVGWTKPTPVQARTFSTMVAGTDVLVQSQTGSGKTGAFCLPWLASRFEIGPADITGVQLLVLLPTRELAKQVCDELGRLATDSPVDVLAVYGGTAMAPQLDALSRGVHAVVGTPGRILDHIRRRSLDLSRVRTVVLDECDEMLSMGFLEDIRAILSACPRERQTCLFSATVPRDIERIAGRNMRDPVRIELSGDEIAAAEIDHAFYSTMGTIKTRDLLDIIVVEDPPVSIVFCNTREETRLVANVLQKHGYSAEALSSDLTQAAREKVMGMFREHKLRFLVATDVAARGIDVSHVSHVINYSFPENSEIYVHRTGRTGRAGRAGQALSIVSPQEIGSFYTLTKSYKSIRFTERKLPPPDELTAIRTEVKLDRISHDFSQPVSPEWLLLARRLSQDPRGERVIAYLLHEALEAERIRSRPQVEDEIDEQQQQPSGFDEREARDRGRGGRERDRDRRPRERERERGRERGRDRGRGHESRDRHEPRGYESRERSQVEASADGEQPRRSRRRDYERTSEPIVTEPRVESSTLDESIELEAQESVAADEGETTLDAGDDADTGEAVAGEGTGEGDRPKKRRRRRRRRRGPGEVAVEADAVEAAAGDERPENDGDAVSEDGESDDDSDADEGESEETEGASEGGESRSKRKRRRRRRRRGGGKPGEEVAAAPAPQPTRDELSSHSGSSRPGSRAEAQRRRRRQRRDSEPATEVQETPEPARVSQDQIIIDIDETELTAVRDTFGEIDEFDELTLKGRRRAVLDDLSAELDVDVVDLTDRDAEDDADEDEDDGEAEAELDEPEAARVDAESSAEPTPVAEPESEAGDKKKRRRRRRRKKAAPALPELTCPPHKDFWEVWASKFSAADFKRDEDSGDEASDDEDDIRTEAQSVDTDGAEGNDLNDRPDAQHGSDGADDGDVPLIDTAPPEDALVRVDLNIGRRHGQKAAHVRSLLRRLTGLHGKAVKDLTVRDQNTLFRMDARHFDMVVARLEGSIVESVSLTLVYAQDDAPTPGSALETVDAQPDRDDPSRPPEWPTSVDVPIPDEG